MGPAKQRKTQAISPPDAARSPYRLVFFAFIFIVHYQCHKLAARNAALDLPILKTFCRDSSVVFSLLVHMSSNTALHHIAMAPKEATCGSCRA